MSRSSSWGALIALLGVLLASTAAPAQNTAIAAIVNEQIVSVHDIEERLKLVTVMLNMPDSEENRRRLRPQLLQNLINERLQMQEAQRLNINVSAGEIQEATSQIERQYRLPTGGLTDYLQRHDLKLATLLDQVKASIAWSKVIRRQIRPQVDVGEEEIDEYLARLRSRGGSTEYEASEIFLPVENPGDESAGFALAQRIATDARSGTSFAALARQYSQAVTAASGGDLGVVREGQLDERLERTLASLSPGQISDPIRTETGVYLLQLRDKRTTATASAADATVSLRRIFLAVPPNAPANEVRTQSELARTVSESVQGCEDMDRLGREVGAAQPVDVGNVKLAELPQELRNALAPLPVGKASKPIRLGDGFIVLMACNRSESMAGLPSREEVARLLGSQRIDTLQRRYLRDLRRVAFIEFRV